MAKKDDKYNVSLSLRIDINKVIPGGEGVEETVKDWHNGQYQLSYPGMDYAQIVATQQALSRFGQILCNLGWGDAAATGFDLKMLEEARKIANGEIEPGKGGK
jgi:hypothetical protein